MTHPQRTFVLFEYPDGSRMAYELRLQAMTVDFPLPDIWEEMASLPPARPPQVTLEGTLLHGVAWQPGAEFHPPGPPKAVTS